MTNVVEKYEPNLWLKLDDINVTDGAVAFNSGYNYTAGSWVFRSDQWIGQQLTLPYNGVNSVVTSDPNNGGPNPLEDCHISVNAPYDGMDMSGSTVETGSPLAMMWYKVHAGFFGPQYLYWDSQPVAFYLMNQYPGALFEGQPIPYENIMWDLVEFINPGTGWNGLYDNCAGGGHIGQMVEAFQTTRRITPYDGAGYTPAGLWNGMLSGNWLGGAAEAWTAVANCRLDWSGFETTTDEFSKYTIFDHVYWTLYVTISAGVKYLKFDSKISGAYNLSADITNLISPDEWVRLIVLYDGLADGTATNGTMSMYFGDTLLDSTTSLNNTEFPQDAAGTVYIGRDADASNWLMGYVDSAAFWDYALPLSYIQATWVLHQVGQRGHPPDYATQGTLEYATWEAVNPGAGATLIQNNRKDLVFAHNQNTGFNTHALTTTNVDEGKHYIELELTDPSVGNYISVGFQNTKTYPEDSTVFDTQGLYWFRNGDVRYNGALVGRTSPYEYGDVVQAALDSDSGEVWFGVNGTWAKEPVDPIPREAVSLLLHMDGSQGSTTFTDSSDYNHTVSVSNAFIDQAQQQFGDASARFTSASNSYITVGPHSSLDLKDNDFTIEMWIRPTNTTGGKSIFRMITPQGASIGGYGPITIYLNASTLQLYLASCNSTWNILSGGSGSTITANVWTHIAVCRYGDTFTIYNGGVLRGTWTYAGELASGDVTTYIGDSNPQNAPFDGWIDEVRVTKAALYSGNFTPPAAPFTLAAATNTGDPANGLYPIYSSTDLQEPHAPAAAIRSPYQVTASLRIKSDPADFSHTPPTGFSPFTRITPRFINATKPVLYAEPVPDGDPYFHLVTMLYSFDDTAYTNQTYDYIHNFTLSSAGNAIKNDSFGAFPNSGSLQVAGGASGWRNNGSWGSTWQAGEGIDFTFECWIYPTAGGYDGGDGYFYSCIAGTYGSGSGAQGYIWTLDGTTASTKDRMGFYDGSAWHRGNVSVSVDTWHHVAVTRTGTTLRLFVGGTEVYQGTSTGKVDWYSRLWIGGSFWNSYNAGWYGNIDEYRITQYLARYTSNFTPPTDKFPRYGSDEHFDKVSLFISPYSSTPESTRRVIDLSRYNHALVPRKNVTNSTGSKILFNRGFLEIADHPSFDFGSGDWTIEWRHDFLDSTSGYTGVALAKANSSGFGPFEMRYVGTGSTARCEIYFSTNGSSWTHFNNNCGTVSNNVVVNWCLMRSGSTIYLFADNVLKGTVDIGANALVSNNEPVTIGARRYPDASGNHFFWGHHLPELYRMRVTKGQARYTSTNFKNITVLESPIEFYQPPSSIVLKTSDFYEGITYRDKVLSLEPTGHWGFDEQSLWFNSGTQYAFLSSTPNRAALAGSGVTAAKVKAPSLVATHFGFSLFNTDENGFYCSRTMYPLVTGHNDYIYTMCGWFKPVSGAYTHANNEQVLLSANWPNGNYGGVMVGYDAVADKFWRFIGVGNDTSTYEVSEASANGLFSTAHPNFIVMMSFGLYGETTKLYCNNVEITGWSLRRGLRQVRRFSTFPSHYISIGGVSTAGWANTSFCGYIDEVSFFNRLLTQADLAYLMAAGGLQSDGLGGFETFDPNGCTEAPHPPLAIYARDIPILSGEAAPTTLALSVDDMSVLSGATEPTTLTFSVSDGTPV